MPNESGKSSTGLDANVAGLLAYLGGLLTGIIFFILEKENKFVRFHALQSMLTFGGLFVLQTAFMYLGFLAALTPLINLLSLVLWILLMVKAYQNQMFKLPVIGDIAEQKSAPRT